MIQSFSLFMTMGQLQPFFPPQSFYLFVINRPAFNAKEMGNLTISIPAILFGQPDHRQTQFLVIIMFSDVGIALRTTCQADRFAGSSLRCIQFLTDINNSLTQIGNRQALGFK